jgi:hypothetical protein
MAEQMTAFFRYALRVVLVRGSEQLSLIVEELLGGMVLKLSYSLFMFYSHDMFDSSRSRNGITGHGSNQCFVWGRIQQPVLLGYLYSRGALCPSAPFILLVSVSLYPLEEHNYGSWLSHHKTVKT